MQYLDLAWDLNQKDFTRLNEGVKVFNYAFNKDPVIAGHVAVKIGRMRTIAPLPYLKKDHYWVKHAGCIYTGMAGLTIYAKVVILNGKMRKATTSVVQELGGILYTTFTKNPRKPGAVNTKACCTKMGGISKYAKKSLARETRGQMSEGGCIVDRKGLRSNKFWKSGVGAKMVRSYSAAGK